MEHAPENILSKIDKSFSDRTNQLTSSYEAVKVGFIIARPTYSRDELLAFCKQSSVNMRCIITKAATIAGIGYEFSDLENATNTGVVNFIDNLIDRNGNPQSLCRLLSDWYIDFGIFGDSYVEIARDINNKPINLLTLSAKNCFLDMDRTQIIQIIQTGKKNNQFVVFRPYTEQAEIDGKIERDTLSLSRKTAFDDVYGVPVWVSALSAITENYLISKSNIETMNNIVNPSFMFMSFGNISESLDRSIKDSVKKIKNQKGQAVVLNFPEKDAKIQIERYGNQQIDGNYINQREKNELEIMSIHGITPDLYGTLQSGGISSGEKATGALKIFVQTVVRQEQEMLSKLFDNFLRIEFAGYQGGFTLKEIDLTDNLEDQQAQQLQANIQQTYVTMNSLQMLNEYRLSINLTEISEDDFDKMRLMPDFNINAPAAF